MQSVKLWYHTMELGPGEVTPGWFDLRPILDGLPWPDVRGKRCLDVGTYDGHLAFELERRGASEVVALDIADHESWDWPLRVRRKGIALGTIAGEKGAGFAAAKAALGSKAERVELSVYDATPERLGRFDVVVCGDLLLHLRDPVRAVEAINGVCDGHFLSHEEILPRPLVFNRHRAVAELDGTSDLCQWWTPSRAGHQRIVEAGGFDIERSVRPYCVAFGPAHPRVPLSPGSLHRRAAVWALTRASGVPHAAVLARPI